ncbi:MAG: ABC transporter permease subunit [Proteobacteria bacterium]|jgi:ABC-type maltose transport system permease subunit|nr:ABC transporter permease subunit [Pseudomonadota bacterium]NCX25054.1 ABC transporter permease subunit [Pseudomonadota bacterium]NCX34627.1 ABC transporter permease subunit [Pseudomonadota bacterium]
METYDTKLKIVLRHLVALIFCIFALYPILFVVTNSFSETANLYNAKLIPDEISFQNFIDLNDNPLAPFYSWLLNTYKISFVAAFFNVLLGTMAAFAFSKLKFKGRRIGLLTLILIQMFPAFLAFVALYLLFFQVSDIIPIIGLGTHAGLILVYLGGSIGFNAWLIKGYMDTIPDSLSESAKIDGATEFQTFYRIIAPLARPSIIVIFIITFIGFYAEFILASLFLRDPEMWTVAVGVNTLFIQTNYDANWGAIASSSVIAAAPIAITFLIFQDKITGGLITGSVKG